MGNISKSDELDLRLTPRDRYAIPFVVEQSFVRLDQLGQWLAPHLEPATHKLTLKEKRQWGGARKEWPRDYRRRLHATRQIVDRWRQHGLAVFKRGWTDEPIWIMITARGLREFGYTLYKERPFPELYRLPHYYHITRVRMELARSRKVPSHSWISERYLYAQLPPGQSGVKLPHRPDGELLLSSGNKVAVEVELRVKQSDEQEKIFHSLLSDYSSIWYFCSQITYDTIVFRLSSYPEEARRRFTIFRLDEEKDHLSIE